MAALSVYGASPEMLMDPNFFLKPFLMLKPFFPRLAFLILSMGRSVFVFLAARFHHRRNGSRFFYRILFAYAVAIPIVLFLPDGAIPDRFKGHGLTLFLFLTGLASLLAAVFMVITESFRRLLPARPKRPGDALPK